MFQGHSGKRIILPPYFSNVISCITAFLNLYSQGNLRVSIDSYKWTAPTSLSLWFDAPKPNRIPYTYRLHVNHCLQQHTRTISVPEVVPDKLSGSKFSTITFKYTHFQILLIESSMSAIRTDSPFTGSQVRFLHSRYVKKRKLGSVALLPMRVQIRPPRWFTHAYHVNRTHTW